MVSDKLEYFYAKQVYSILLPKKPLKKLSYSNLQLSPPPVLFLSSGLPRGLAASAGLPVRERLFHILTLVSKKKEKKKKCHAKSSRAASNSSVAVLLLLSSFFFSFLDCVINLLSFPFFHSARMHLPDVGIIERFNHEI